MRERTSPSCADLIRASINLRKKPFEMDCRVKPGNDSRY